MSMPIRWRLFLPVVGLIVFTGISYQSYRASYEDRAVPGRFFLWSTLRLDSDPLNRRYQSPCAQSKDPCVDWDLATVDSWAHPKDKDRLFVLSALPAFLVGTLIVFGLGGKFGVSEVTSFMITMPLLTFIWFYFVGWLIDRWRFKRSQLNGPRSRTSPD